MYFALAGLLRFRFPLEGKSERSQNRFFFQEKYDLTRTEIVEGLVQDNEIHFLQDEDGFALDDKRIPAAGMFVKNMSSRKIGIGPVGGKAYVEVDLGDFPNVNMWIPPVMPFACIEPMLGHHDLQDSPMAISKKSYLTALPAGEKRSYSYSISVKE